MSQPWQSTIFTTSLASAPPATPHVDALAALDAASALVAQAIGPACDHDSEGTRHGAEPGEAYLRDLTETRLERRGAQHDDGDDDEGRRPQTEAGAARHGAQSRWAAAGCTSFADTTGGPPGVGPASRSRGRESQPGRTDEPIRPTAGRS